MAEIDDQLRAYYNGEVAQRALRPLGDERERRVREFVELLVDVRARTVLEVGCGAGRDGAVIAAGGLAYVGLDLSPAAVATCRDLGLDAWEGSAVALPFADDTFDAAWTMSTLMHLPGDGLSVALTELMRVVRRGGLVEIGLWGHTSNRNWTDPHGRYFKHRRDEDLRRELERIGEVLAFDTWAWFNDGGHYQWARIRVA